jgi:hypothetical protein
MWLFGVFLRWLYLFCSPRPESPAGIFFYAVLLPMLGHLLETVVGSILIQFSRADLLAVLAAIFIGVRYRRGFLRQATPRAKQALCAWQRKLSETYTAELPQAEAWAEGNQR